MRFICTDSWDVTNIENSRVSNFLSMKNFVVIPDTAGFNQIHHRKNITSYISGLSPKFRDRDDEREKNSNPWSLEVWRSLFNCSDVDDCDRFRIDWAEFQLDTKVDFVVDAVLAFSDALERCWASPTCHKNVNTDDFFRNFILTTDIDGEREREWGGSHIIKS